MSIKCLGIESEEAALSAVKQDGHALRFVINQTEESCLEAVKQNGYALQYVKEQTEAICLEAVKQNGYALDYVRDKDLFIKIAKELNIEIEV